MVLSQDTSLSVLAPSKILTCNTLRWGLSKILSLFEISFFNLQGGLKMENGTIWLWVAPRQQKKQKTEDREKLRGQALAGTWGGTGFTVWKERTASGVGEGWVPPARAAPCTYG